MSVKVQTATGGFESANLVGRTVGSIRHNETYSQLLGLVGGEVAEVSQSGGTWSSVDDDETLYDGDTLRFTKAAGDKG